MDIKDLRAKARTVEPSVRIGKFGATVTMIEEIRRQLKARKLVKIKLLQNAPHDDIKELGKELAQKTDSSLIDVVGRVVVLYKGL